MGGVRGQWSGFFCRRKAPVKIPVGCRIIGVGCAVPTNVVTNDDLTELVETSDEWITTRTGIKQRRIVTAEESCFKAYGLQLDTTSANGVS